MVYLVCSGEATRSRKNCTCVRYRNHVSCCILDQKETCLSLADVMSNNAIFQRLSMRKPLDMSPRIELSGRATQAAQPGFKPRRTDKHWHPYVIHSLLPM